MTEKEAARAVIAHMEASKAVYVLVGGLAFNLYGIPRFTKDADLVCTLAGAELDALLRTLPTGFSVEPQARMELFTGTMRWVVVTPVLEFKAEIFLLGTDAHHGEEFQRRRRAWLPALEIEAWVARAEDLVIQKLRWFRIKDQGDVRDILSVQGAALDLAYIESWCDRHGTRARLEELRRSLPPGL